MSEQKLNERAARKLAQDKDFDEDEMLFCPGCGRTIVRSQNIYHPGRKDSVYCTCESKGLPFIELNRDND